MDSINSPWRTRLSIENKYHDEWATKFKCTLLEKYYEGLQWEDFLDATVTIANERSRPYTVNEFYSTGQIKLATYLFARPHFLITPAPKRFAEDPESAMADAQMKEDLVNEIISDPRSNFATEIRRTFLDSLFRFGIVQVSYDSDWV